MKRFPGSWSRGSILKGLFPVNHGPMGWRTSPILSEQMVDIPAG